MSSSNAAGRVEVAARKALAILRESLRRGVAEDPFPRMERAEAILAAVVDSYGARLRAARAREGYTQRELGARLCDRIGRQLPDHAAQQLISRLEQGRRLAADVDADAVGRALVSILDDERLFDPPQGHAPSPRSLRGAAVPTQPTARLRAERRWTLREQGRRAAEAFGEGSAEQWRKRIEALERRGEGVGDVALREWALAELRLGER